MKIMFMITFEYANAIFSIPLTGKRPSSIVFCKDGTTHNETSTTVDTLEKIIEVIIYYLPFAK